MVPTFPRYSIPMAIRSMIYDPNSTIPDPVTNTYARTQFAGNVIPANRLNPVAQKVFGNISTAGNNPLSKTKYQQSGHLARHSELRASKFQKHSRRKANHSQSGSDLRPQPPCRTVHVHRPNRIGSFVLCPYSPGHTRQRRAERVADVHDCHRLKSRQCGAHRRAIQPRFPRTGSRSRLDNSPGSACLHGTSFHGLASTGITAATTGTGPRSIATIRKTIQTRSPAEATSSPTTAATISCMFGFEVDNSRITTFETGQPGGNYAVRRKLHWRTGSDTNTAVLACT